MIYALIFVVVCIRLAYGYWRENRNRCKECREVLKEWSWNNTFCGNPRCERYGIRV